MTFIEAIEQMWHFAVLKPCPIVADADADLKLQIVTEVKASWYDDLIVGMPTTIADQISISSDGMPALEEERMKAHRTDPLETLVKDGSISKEQKDAVEDALWVAMENQQATSAAGSQNVTSKTNPLASLVSSGTIREDQQAIIKTAFEASRPQGPPPGGRAPGPPPSGGGKEINSVLSILVSDDTITEDQKTAIQKTLLTLIDALENSDSTSFTDSSSNSTSDTSNDFMDEILKKLVADGSISDEQKTAHKNRVTTQNATLKVALLSGHPILIL